MQSQDSYQLIDLDRYPLDDLDSEAGLQLVADTQASLAAIGACSLPGLQHIALWAAGGRARRAMNRILIHD